MLEKIKTESIPDKIYESIKNEILGGTYKPGDKLPTEQELCKLLGVSRPSVKTALNKLCALGIVEQRVGDGTYVKGFDVQTYFSQIKDYMFKDVSREDLYSFRVYEALLEMLVAMQTITQQEIGELEQLLGKMKIALDAKQYDDLTALDYSFHCKTCQITRNKFILKIFEGLGCFTYHSIYDHNHSYGLGENNPEHTYELHCKMLEAIKNKDIEEAVQVYNELLRFASISLSGKANS